MAFDKGGGVCGVLPYYRTRRLGVIPVIQLPPLTAYAGPWVHYPSNTGLKKNSRYGFEQEVLQQLIRQLPRVPFFHQTFRPEIQNWLPFYWSGFRQTTRYTYRLRVTEPLSTLYTELKNTVRTDLRKAEARTQVSQEEEPAIVFELNSRSFARKQRAQPYSREVFLQLHNALRERGQARCLIAREPHTQTPQAGLYLAFDNREAAVVLAGFDPAHRAARAMTALYWEAIRFCSEKGLQLDFEGSMHPGIESFFRAFGGDLTPYFRVWKFF